MDIGILYICTGNYSVFWEDFYITCEKNFLPDLSKTYFVFSDERELKFLDSPNVVYSYQKKLGWPYDTLDRFSVFSKVSDQLKDFDYLFFFNANSLVVGENRTG